MATKKKSVKKKAAQKKVKTKPKPKAKATSKSKGKMPSKKVTTKRKSVKSGGSSTKKAPKKRVKPIVRKNIVTKKSATTSKKSTAPKKTDAKSPKKSKKRVKIKSKKRVKILSKNLLVDLATAIKEAVAPEMMNMKGREIVGSSQSGDATFHLDAIAEKTLLNFLTNAKLSVAYYSEDAGYTTFTSDPPTHLLVVDPIDGTRAAKCGFENCVISICATRVLERPTIADMDNAIVMELTTDRYFYAERGGGARAFVNGHSRKIKLAQLDDIERMAWSMTVPARPAELIFPVSAKLIDISSLKGGFFACNSSSYSLTRLLTNQLDACVDIANRFYRDIQDVVEDSFINAGRGAVLGVCPYDFAAALMIAEEAGCIITDAYGGRFDDVLLLDSSPQNHQSIVAATGKSLHAKLLGYYDTRIVQLEELLQKRYEANQA
ncbi:MAG TPA: hypothetical protein EYN96_12665 [Candidatus Hydrogenedentes bacterium]|nr:hypothetical protein [Candidatus Hydrogenedentota bacterium]